MPRRWTVNSIVAAAFLMGYFVANQQSTVQGQAAPGAGFAAVPSSVGALDLTGPYDVARDWPKDISTLPGNEKWTFGAGQGVFAESPNRVYVLQRGQLPVLPKLQGPALNKALAPVSDALHNLAPGSSFPIMGFWRNATNASPPGTLDVDGRAGNYDNDGSGKNGVDFLWENCIFVVDANGNIIETWKQWDKMLRRPHSVFISPYDAQKNVWIVDDYRHAIFKFTNDGKTLLQTIGTPNVHASDDKHFFRPTFMAFQNDGSFYVADGYGNTRVVKFDKDGKYLLAWGEPGQAGGNETRPNFMNNVHGVSVDRQTRQVYVNDRGNRRIQVFDENGKFIRMWTFGGPDPSNMHFVHIDADRRAWVFDNAIQKLAQFDLNGHLIYSWGSLGAFPGALWGVHGISVDQQGNLYLAAVGRSGVQKFTPKPGANPALLVGKNTYSAWK